MISTITVLNRKTNQTQTKELRVEEIKKVLEGVCYFCSGCLYTAERVSSYDKPVIRVGRCDICWLDFQVSSTGVNWQLNIWERLAEDGPWYGPPQQQVWYTTGREVRRSRTDPDRATLERAAGRYR